MSRKSHIIGFFIFSISICGYAQNESRGINLNFMDKSVKPSDNFFRYVNGTWLDQTDIPADRTRWGSFDELREKTDKDMMLILNEALNVKKCSRMTVE